MTWTEGLGITSGWDSSDLAEVSEHSRELWRKMKARNGWPENMACRDIPGFFECLQEMYDGGYSFTDIASVFGLSRERVRQLFNDEPRLRFTDTGSLFRYWDPDASQFMPVKREAIKRRWHELQRSRRRRRRQQRRRGLVAELQRAIEEVGHVPTIGELVAHSGRHVTDWARYWRYRVGGRERSYTVALDRLYRSAGHVRPDARGRSDATLAARRVLRRHTDDQTIEMRRLYADGTTVAEICRHFSANHGTVWKIVRRETYRDVADEPEARR